MAETVVVEIDGKYYEVNNGIVVNKDASADGKITEADAIANFATDKKLGDKTCTQVDKDASDATADLLPVWVPAA